MKTWKKLLGAFLLMLIIVLVALGLLVLKRALGYEVSYDTFVFAIAASALYVGCYNSIENNTKE